MNNICFIGKCDNAFFQQVLEEIEQRYPKSRWAHGDKPSDWNPVYHSGGEKYVALELTGERKLTYFTDSTEEEFERDMAVFINTSKYSRMTFEEFMNGTEPEIQNEMDISFLYG